MFNRIVRLKMMALKILDRDFVEAGRTPSNDNQVVTLGMSVLISIALLSTGIYILFNNDGDNYLRELAAGWIGMVVQYWLD